MTRIDHIRHEFVDTIPDQLDDGVVYVCIRYATVVHRCCCGCGYEAVTPLAPTEWSLTFDGRSISLSPSVGNWSFPCQSHYWVRRNHVQWAQRWNQDEINAGRQWDRTPKLQPTTEGTDERHTKSRKPQRSRVRLPRWPWRKSI